MRWKILIKRIISVICYVLLPTKDIGGRILLFHSVGNSQLNDPMGLSVSLQNFKCQIEYLVREKFEIVSLEELLDRIKKKTANDRMIAITFDDGYKDNLINAFPVLDKYKIKFTLFISPSFLNGYNHQEGYWNNWEYLNWDDVVLLKDKGVELGSHSVNHKDMTKLEDEQLIDEIKLSKEELVDRLHCEIKAFSYPYGRFNSKVKKDVEKCGFEMACCSITGANRFSRDIFELRRTEITGYDTLFDFKMKLAGGYDWLGWIYKIRANVWR